MDKQSLRIWAKNLRKELDMKALGSLMAEKLSQTELYKKSKNVMIFYPLKHEADLLELLQDKSKTFYLPRIEGENIVCCTYKEGDELCMSCFKTQEPVNDETPKSVIDLAIVPALAADRNHYRLGYGGGYYDRFLKDFKGKTVVCIPEALFVESVYPEEHDIKIDEVLTV